MVKVKFCFFFPLDSVWNILFSLKGKQKEQRVSGFNQAKKKVDLDFLAHIHGIFC